MEAENDNFIFNLLGVCVCILCGALGAGKLRVEGRIIYHIPDHSLFIFSVVVGLTMGLMSIENTKLEIVQMTGSPSDAAAAKTIMPILGNHHLLLVCKNNLIAYVVV